MPALTGLLWPRRLAAQLGLLSVLLLVGGTGAFGWFVGAQQARVAFDSLRSTGSVLAGNLAIDSAEPLARRDYATLELTALRYADLPDVVSVRIFNDVGAAVSSVLRGANGPLVVYDPVPDATPTAPELTELLSADRSRLTLIRSVTAGDSRLGRVELELSLATGLAARRQLLRDTVAFGMLLALGVLLLLGLLVQRPLRAIRSAVAFAATLDRHRGDTMAVDASTLETEQLGDVLNQVSQKLREQELTILEREAETRKLALVASRTSNAVIITDADGVTEWVNDGFFRISGYRPEEVIGLKPGALLQGPGTDPETVRTMRERIARQEGFEAEVLNYAKDGTPYWLALEVRPIRDEHGKLTNFMAIESDITERRETITALRDSERRFRSVVESLAEGLFITGPDDVVSYASPQVEAITGYPPEAFVGRRAYEILLPEAEHERAGARNRERLTGVTERYEVEIVHRDGRRLLLDNHAAPLRDSEGRVIGSLGAFTDITESKRVQRQLVASEERYRTLFAEAEAQRDFALTVMNTIGQGLTVVGEDWTFEYVNPAYADFLGYTPEALIGTSPIALAPPEDRPALERIRGERASGRQSSYETRIRHALGHYIDVLVTGVPRLRDGEITGTIAVASDITEQKRFEAELHRAKESAETANRAKNEFLSRMSHELRTPLNAILGFAQLLELDEGLDDDQVESVERILKAGRHLLDLIDEVLDISRIEAGRIGLSLEAVDLRAAVEEAVALMRPLAVELGVDVAVEGLDGMWVEADLQRLKQVLLNLLSNGVKFNRRGGRVVVRGGGDTATRVRFEVSDTGAGIAAELLPRLFTPFDRLGAEQSGIEGSGIGLALSRRLVEAMGGEIEVRSAVGRGTSFGIVLPRSEARTLLPAPPQAQEDRTVGRARKATIVYIEDNLSNLVLVERILQRVAQVELLTAMQGRLGLELIRRQRPDLVLLDLHLPDLGGEEVLARLRAEPATRDIPVIILSADATPTRIDDLLARGADRFLTKPIDVAELLAAVREHLWGEVGGERPQGAAP